MSTQGKPRKWLLLVPLLLGVAIFVWLSQNRPQPQQSAPAERARTVRVIEVPQLDVVPRAVGYGNVSPDRVWEAVAEVGGKIIEAHPRLQEGELIQAGEILLKIDPSDYQLALAQAETEIKATEVQLAELDVKEANTRASLAIERDALALAEKELERNRALAEKGTITRSQLEQEQRAALAQRQSLQAQQNALNLIPSERQLLEAQLARYRAQRDSAALDLERTVVTLPFAARLAGVNIERSQFVRQGDVMLSADSIAVAEVTAQLAIAKLRPLIRPQQAPLATLDGESTRRILRLAATVRLPGQSIDVEWPARFVRVLDAVDEQTRTVGIVVAVDEPYQQAQPGIRPPLVKGMFAEVELRGQIRPQSLVIPRAVVHDGDTVYLVDADNRLQRRSIKLAFSQGGFGVVESGLAAGERLILSDVLPAIEGMLLDPRPDTQALAELEREAGGAAP